MRNSCQRVILTSVFVFLSFQAWADNTGIKPEELLKRMVEAANTTSYMGDFVYSNDGILESMRVFYGVDSSGTRERLEALNGPPREILKINGKVDCFFPYSAEIQYDRRLKNPADTFNTEIIQNLDENYSLRFMGKDRIAGRDGYRVEIKPRTPDRYGFWIWIDEQTGLLLKMSMINEKREPLEQFMFVDITVLDEVPPSLFETAESRQKKEEGAPETESRAVTQASVQEKPALDVSHDENILKIERALTTSDWKVSFIPQGFRLQHHQRLPGGHDPETDLEHLLFTDGLATISVYIEPLGKVKAWLGHSRIGAVSAFGRVISDHQIMVIGEVPVDTVVSVGESVTSSELKKPQND